MIRIAPKLLIFSKSSVESSIPNVSSIAAISNIFARLSHCGVFDGVVSSFNSAAGTFSVEEKISIRRSLKVAVSYSLVRVFLWYGRPLLRETILRHISRSKLAVSPDATVISDAV